VVRGLLYCSMYPILDTMLDLITGIFFSNWRFPSFFFRRGQPSRLHVEGHQHLVSSSPPADDRGQLAVDLELLHVSLLPLPLAVHEAEGEQTTLLVLLNVRWLPCLGNSQPCALVLFSLQHVRGHMFVSEPDSKKCPPCFVYPGEDSHRGVKPVGVLLLGS
jgi:hypothetical protein